MNREEGARFSFELLTASGRVAEHLEKALLPLGLSLAKFGVLSKLVAAGEPLPLSTLAAQCECVRSNISSSWTVWRRKGLSPGRTTRTTGAVCEPS